MISTQGRLTRFHTPKEDPSAWLVALNQLETIEDVGRVLKMKIEQDSILISYLASPIIC